MKGNAIIERTMLGYEDHGILTCYLYLKQKGSGQGFGGYRLDAPKDAPSEACEWWVRRILKTVGVESWEKLTGNHVQVFGEAYGSIDGIGHITDDDLTFYPAIEIEKQPWKKS